MEKPSDIYPIHSDPPINSDHPKKAPAATYDHERHDQPHNSKSKPSIPDESPDHAVDKPEQYQYE